MTILIHDLISHAEQQDDDPWAGHLRASSLGRCARAVTYWALGYQPSRTSGRSRMVMDDGKLHERDIIARIHAAGHVVYSYDPQHEVTLSNPPVVGHIDGVVEVHGERYLLEIKTMNHFVFQKLWSKGIEAVYPEYHDQVTFYMARLNLTRTLLVVKNRNNAALYEELIPLDLNAYADVLTRAQKTWDCIESGTLANQEYPKDSSHCSWCSYNHHCWPIVDFDHGEGGKEALLVEDGDVIEAADVWRSGKEYEARAKEMISSARGTFETFMTAKGQTSIDADGLKAVASQQTRESISMDVARRELPADVFEGLVKRSKFTTLTIRDTR